MHALIIHKQWLSNILNGIKTWELRGSRTSKIGEEIGLAQKGSGVIVGTAKITKVIGPLTKQDLKLNFDKHQIPDDEISAVTARYKKPYAWVLSEVKRLESPIPYKHPRGAVRWVRVENF